MADAFEKEMDDIDSLLDSEPNVTGLNDPAADGEESSRSVVTDIKGALEDNLKIDTIAKTAKKAIYKVLPNDLGDTLSDVEDEVSETIETLEKSTEGLRKSVSGALKNVGDIAPSFIGDALKSLGNFIYNPEDDEYGSSKEPSEDEVIQEQLKSILGEKISYEARAESINQATQEMTSMEQTAIMARIAAINEQLLKHQTTYVSEYYRKTLELDLKKTLTLVKIYDLLKRDSEIRTKQLEAIVKNTGLPDSMKYKGIEYLKEKAKDDLLEKGLNLFIKNDTIKRMFKGITEDIKDKLYEVTSGSEMFGDMARQLKDMEEMGVGSTRQIVLSMALGEAISGLAGKGAEKVMKKALGDERTLDILSKIEKSISNPSKVLQELAKDSKNEYLKKLLEYVSDKLNVAEYGKTGLTLMKPEELKEATSFDNKTKMAIEKVIPDLLSRILLEVSTIRESMKIETNEDKKLYFNYSRNKFETKGTIKTRYKKHIEEETARLLDKASDKELIKLLTGKEKLKPEEIRDLTNAVINYILDNRILSPYFMRSDGFLKYISLDSVKKLVDKRLKRLENPRNEQDLKDNKKLKTLLEYIKASITNFSNMAEHARFIGAEDILAETGLMNKEDYTRISSSNITDILKGKADDLLLNDYLSKKSNALRSDIVVDENIKKILERYEKIIVGKLKNQHPEIGVNIWNAIKKDPELRKEYEKLSETYKEKIVNEINKETNKKLKPDEITIDLEKKAITEKPITGFATGGYTGEGNKFDVAGIVHKGEYVINKEDLNNLLQAVKNTDVNSILEQVKKISEQVDQASSRINLPEKTYQRLETISKDIKSTFNNVVTNLQKQTIHEKLENTKFLKEEVNLLKTKNITDLGIKDTGTILKVTSKEAKEYLETLISPIKEALSDKKAREELIKTITSPFTNLVDSIQPELNKYVKSVKEFFNRDKEEIFKDIKDLTNENIQKLKDTLRDNGIIDIDTTLTTAKNKIEETTEEAKKFIKEKTGIDVDEKTKEFKSTINNYKEKAKQYVSDITKPKMDDYLFTTEQKPLLLTKPSTEVDPKYKTIFNNLTTEVKNRISGIFSNIELPFNKRPSLSNVKFITDDDIRLLETKPFIETNEITPMGRIANGLKDVLESIPDVSQEFKKNIELINKKYSGGDLGDLKDLLLNKLKETPMYKNKLKMYRTYKSIILALDPSGETWKYLLETHGRKLFSYLQKLHEYAIYQYQEDLLNDDNAEEDKSWFHKFAETYIPTPIKTMFKKFRDSSIGKYLGNRLKGLKEVAKGSFQTFKEEMKLIGKEGLQLFITPTGDIKIPSLLDLAKFTGKTYFGTAKALSKTIKPLYTEIGKTAIDTGKLAGKTGLELMGITNLGRNIRKIKSGDIKPPIPNDLYKLWKAGKLTTAEVMEQLDPDSQIEFELWLKEYTKISTTIPNILHTTGKQFYNLSKTLGERVIRPGYSTVSRGLFTIGKEALTTTLFGKTIYEKSKSETKESDRMKEPKTNEESNIEKITDLFTKKLEEKLDSIFGKENKKEPNNKENKTVEEKVVEAVKETTETNKKLVEELTELKRNLTKKVNPFDKDGDGDRDNNWKDIEERIYGKKKEKPESKEVKETVKEKESSKSWIGMLLGGLTLFLPKLKSMFTSVMDIVKHPLETISKGISSLTGVVWDAIKWSSKETWKSIKWIGEELWKPFKWLGSKLVEGLGSIFKHIPGVSTIIDKAKKAFTTVKDKVTGLFKTTEHIIEKPKVMIEKTVTKLTKTGIAKKIKVFLKVLKDKIIKKLGKKVGAKFLGKIASRLVPVLGWSMLLWDAGWVIYYMVHDHMSLPSAISKQILGFDIFNDNEVEKVKKEHEKTKTNNTMSALQESEEPIVKNISEKLSPHPTWQQSLFKTQEPKQQPYTTAERIYKETLPILKTYDIDIGRLFNRLKEEEGLKLHVYRDSRGYKTIGIGHLLDPSKGGVPLRKILGYDTDTITVSDADRIFMYDVGRITKQLFSKLPWIKTKPELVKEDLIDMAFNLGVNGLMKFRKALNVIKENNFYKAALELRNSLWYKQVGRRAERIVNDFLTLPSKIYTNITTPTRTYQAVNNIDISEAKELLKKEKETKHTSMKIVESNNTQTKAMLDIANKTLEHHTKTNEILIASLKVQKGMYDKLDELTEIGKAMLKAMGSEYNEHPKHQQHQLPKKREQRVLVDMNIRDF